VGTCQDIEIVSSRTMNRGFDSPGGFMTATHTNKGNAMEFTKKEKELLANGLEFAALDKLKRSVELGKKGDLFGRDKAKKECREFEALWEKLWEKWEL